MNSKNEITIVRNYDREFLFYVFCLSGGSIEKMLIVKKEMPPEVWKIIPKRSKLYSLSKEEKWKEKYKEIADDIMDKVDKELGMSYKEKIFKMAHMIADLLMAKFKKAILENDYKWVTTRDVKIMWEICRTERGLPIRINDSGQRFNNRPRWNDDSSDLLAHLDKVDDIDTFVRDIAADEEEYKAISKELSYKPPFFIS